MEHETLLPVEYMTLLPVQHGTLLPEEYVMLLPEEHVALPPLEHAALPRYFFVYNILWLRPLAVLSRNTYLKKGRRLVAAAVFYR